MKCITALTLCASFLQGSAFLPSSVMHRDSSGVVPLFAGKGMGMGMASTTKKKKDKKKGNGMGKGKKNGAVKVSTFDVNASMSRLEKRYDELMLASAKQIANEDTRWGSEEDTSSDERITTEYVVAARAASKAGVKDWIPVAQLCLARPQSEYENSEEVVQAAVSSYCRELSHIAAFGAPLFSTVARNDVQYSVETVDSFHKHVYDSVIEGASDEEMTKSEARRVLGLNENEAEKSTIKQAYRKLSFELHPDRFSGTPEECDEASVQFGQVKLAYETLSSGVRDGGSWYESLGGRARTSFMGPINLLPLSASEEQMKRRQAEGAIVGLDPDLIQTFVARNLRSA